MYNQNIIELIDYQKEESNYNLILEYADGGSLEKMLKKYVRFHIDHAIFYFIQICHSIKYIHFHNIVHRDLKPGNILITKDNIVKLCDFGHSVEIKIGEK